MVANKPRVIFFDSSGFRGFAPSDFETGLVAGSVPLFNSLSVPISCSVDMFDALICPVVGALNPVLMVERTPRLVLIL